MWAVAVIAPCPDPALDPQVERCQRRLGPAKACAAIRSAIATCFLPLRRGDLGADIALPVW